MKIAKQSLSMVSVFAFSMCMSLSLSAAQDEASTKQQAYGQALYERTCVIVDGNDNSAQITADLLVQKIIADESISELLTLGEQEGYTAVQLFGFAQKTAQDNEDQEVAQVLEQVQDELSKTWLSNNPIALVAAVAGAFAAYVHRDYLQQLFFNCLEKLGITNNSGVNQTAPVVDPNAPVVDPNAPIVDPNAPIVDPNAPVVDPGVPVADQAVPVAETVVPEVDPNAPVADPAAPVADLEVPEVNLDAEQKAEAEKVVSDQALREEKLGVFNDAAQTQEAERTAAEEAKVQAEPKHHFGFHNPFGHKKDKKDKRKKSVDMSTKSDEQQSEVTDEQANAADVALQNLVQEELAEEPEKKPYLGPCGGVFGKYEVCEFEPGDSVIIDEGDTEMPSFIKESTDLPEVVIEETETVTVPLVVDNTQQSEDATVTENASFVEDAQQQNEDTQQQNASSPEDMQQQTV